MIALREFPPNPCLVVYHVPFELTRAVVDGYGLSKAHTAPPRVAEVLRIPGVRGVQLFRYEWWVRRTPDATWQALVPAVEAALRQHLGIAEILEFAGDQRYMTFEVLAVNVAKPLVFEGVEAAASHPLGQELFAIEGVAEVLFTPGRVRIRKGAAFGWEAMQPSIEAVLRQFRE
jgi:hypothetical protein